MKDPLGTLRLGGIHVPLTLELLVVSSWAILLDAPHLFATLARTFLDPDERATRGRTLALSLAWFAVGPAAILGPVAAGAVLGWAGRPPSHAAIDAVPRLFIAFVQLWAYHHVVRQHWGFVALYRRKAGETAGERRDLWCVHLAIWLPALIALARARSPILPQLWLHVPIEALGGRTAGALLHPVLWAAYAVTVAALLGAPLRAWLRGEPVNAAKLLYLAPLLPLYVAVFSHPLLLVFVVPIVTIGHNIQYHGIVWTYARRKYASAEERLRVPRAIFSSLLVYGACGLAFTFACYRGPWIEWVRTSGGGAVGRALHDSIGMLAGLSAPKTLALGPRAVGAMLLGFALQHYWLDARIWRVGRDAEVRKNLGVAG